MKGFLRKPLKDYNIIDLGLMSLGAMALVPVGFFVFVKGFDILENLGNDTTEDYEPLEPEIVPENEED